LASQDEAALDGAVDDETADGGVAVPESIFGRPDGPIRRSLAGGRLRRVERGMGGRSLAFRLTLSTGLRGYFKPAQTFNGPRWYAEVVAYHLDRELGFGRVAPAIGRRIAWTELQEAAGDDPRVRELMVDANGDLRGSIIWWIPQRLVALRLPPRWERWLRLEGQPDVVSPFQRSTDYERALEEAPQAAEEPAVPTPEPDLPTRPAELSDMIVFDFLSHNIDRWGSNNTNVRTVGEGGPLMFLDNGAAFTQTQPFVSSMNARLVAVQRFRRSTIEAVRRLDVAAFVERVRRDRMRPTLGEVQQRNLEQRRQFLLEHVDGLIRAHGEAAVLPW
jgi:hypothetical protein